ncbi:MAG: acyl-CoA/acyl-ACP dehydrogenase [Pseudomonadales bacterium]|nr:acyl-CoA/acyl-ACP dehydrogenase [Pseudomonadales bacterium]MCP5190450.1 acyl-CoA/acyl-ACP dehydrogenase [Pseudomonadales bacterium]MCP5203372.1 acyl-CoA/acyl-ACP dehydrogenase [Pseudomonadales bacterium]
MREIIDSLFSSSPHHELYLGVIEAAQGVVREFSGDAWKRKMLGDQALYDDVVRAVRGAGLMGLGVDEKYGGMGGGLLGQVLVTDILAQHGLASLATIVTGFSREPLLNHGTDAQIENYAVPSISGEKSFCILATEPDAGSNTFNISTRAVQQGDRWILNGQKAYISQADAADYGFLIARTDLEAKGALSVFVLDMKSPGIEMQQMNINIHGGERQYLVFFDNVELPADALVGEEGMGGKYMFAGLNAERLMVSALAVGTADLALRETVAYVNERKLFGDRPTGSYQAVQHPLAQYKADTEAARLLMYFGTRLYDDGKDAGLYANMAKLQSSTAAANMCDAAIQSHGGGGMDEDTGMLSLWRSARALRIAPLNNEMILNYIAQHGIGLPRSY